jgi:ABC-type dipeptide/oligopeptide/nickel transport system permease component
VRFVAALLLPVLVPAIITLIIWALPGDPATTICPPATCPDEARALLVETYHLTSPWSFLAAWLGKAVFLDFGRSPVAFAGFEVNELLASSVPNTALVMLLALTPVSLGMTAAATGLLPRRADGVLQGVGIVPAVLFALFAVAALTINFGPDDPAAFTFGLPGGIDWEIMPLKLGAAGLVLGLADGALSGAVTGTRSIFESEVKQRYIGIAVLRGEGVLANALPNVLPTLVGQVRGRVLHLLSGTVVVEVVLGIDGIGDLLWRGTLSNDFFIVLAAAWGFSLLSSVLLFLQACSEVAVAMVVRRAPAVPA